MKLLVLLLPAVLLATVSPAGCELYYVRGSSPNATPCPPEASTCLTLQEYVDNSSEFLPKNVSDVEFRFLSGEYSLSKPFEVEGGRNITLRSANITSVWEKLDVRVKCKYDSYFLFDGIATLSIRGIAFYECGSATYNKCALTLKSVVDLNVQDVEFVDSFQADILANNLYRECTVTDMIGRAMAAESNVSFHIIVSISNPNETIPMVLKFSSMVFDHDAIGLEDYSSTTTHYHNGSSVTLQNITITYTDEAADSFSYDVALYIQTYIPVFIEGLTSYSPLTGHLGALLIETCGSLSIMDSSISGSQIISLRTCISIPGLQKQAVAEEKSGPEPYIQNVLVSNCSFIGALIITGPTELNTIVTLKKLFFKDNNGTKLFAKLSSSIVSLVDLPNVTIEGVHFTNSRGATPVFLINTTIHIFRENYFIGNHAFEGGGMVFIDNSFLVLHDDSLLVFKDNHADNVGGAWYVSSEGNGLYDFGAVIRTHTCFIKLHLPLEGKLSDLNITVQFINNSASNGGNVLYGGDIDLCPFDGGAAYSISFGFDFLSQTSIFIYEPKNDISRWSSAPTRVCLCENGVPNCLEIFSAVQAIYPGQSFNISVVTVGQRFGVVNGTVYGQLLPQTRQLPSTLESSQKSQLVGQPECTTLTYAIRSKNHIETIALTANSLTVTEIVDTTTVDDEIYEYNITGQISQDLLYIPVYVNVSLLNCPAGFILSEESSQCVCDPTITRNHLTCDIDIGNGTVERSGELWVSILTSNQNTSQDGVVVSLHCPNGYCKQSTQHINLLNPDVQCNFNRSGILCGGCPPGLSLALGSNRCLRCSNIYIALLVPFAVSGVLLVLLIQMLDLTVAVGTFNGLIFYANIVKSYESIFFVPGQTNILTVFISWLNLDLGIETCFFSGQDGYIKTWLQFAFPLYIWVLAGLIVFLSRYTTSISASNSVPVLATMFLLSYNKLFRTFITAFSFVTLELPGNSSLTTWKFDANVSFLDTKHIILFLTSLLVFTFAWLPYTLVLFFYQCLLRFNHRRGCRWVFRLKPFFDANFGPLKDKHLYWVGVLLLARAVLLLIFVVSNSSDGTVISVAVVSISLILYNSFTGHVYKSWILSLLENSFFVNLAILCVATAKLSINQAPVIYTSISVAFLEFIGIVCYHCYRRVLSLYQKYRGNRRDYVELDQDHGPPQEEVVKVTHSEIDVYNTEGRMALREPLLDD